MKATRYGNCNSVTTRLVTEKRSCSVPSKTLPLRVVDSQSIVYSNQFFPRISLCNNESNKFSKFGERYSVTSQISEA